MNIDKYVPCDFYPRELTHKQIQDPSSVIKDFFRIGKLKKRQQSLREWRDFVIKDEHYTGDKFGPGTLLFTYQWNIKLMEALYLLLLDSRNQRKIKPITDLDLMREECDWPEYPDNLSEEELKNPLIAVGTVFKEAMLPYYRDILWQWLEEALTTRVAAEEMSVSDIVPVYENLLRLYSAAWVIQMRIEDAEEGTGDTEEGGNNPSANDTSIDKAHVKLKPMEAALSPAAKLGLNEIIRVILKAVPTVRTIYCLGSHPHPFTYYLLVLIDDGEKTPEHEIANKIEDHCRYLGLVFVLAHKVSSARQGRADGKFFWNNIVEQAGCVYYTPGLGIGACQEVDKAEQAYMATASWERWGIQADGFLQGAKQYLDDDNYSLAVFMLHQASESAFIAIINAVLGYRLSSHNLSRMLKLTLLFTEELRDVFELRSAEGIRAFDLLQTSYSFSRYQQDFKPDSETVRSLLPKVKMLLERSKRICRQFIAG